MKYTVQVAPEDCTGWTLCVEVCPAKSKKEAKVKAINMKPQPEIREQEKENFEFFLGLPEADRRSVKIDSVKGSQFLRPLFEFSGACSGCGETPYIKLASQLFGDRMMVANATAAHPFMAATCRQRRGRRMLMDAGHRGRIRYLKITRNSVSACA